MSMNDAIEAAWKEYCEKHYEKCHTGPLSIGFFAAGYRAAMRSLYREVKPEDLDDGECCWVLVKEGWRVARFQDDSYVERDGYFSFIDTPDDLDETVSAYGGIKILRAAIVPTPSDIFGEEGCK